MVCSWRLAGVQVSFHFLFVSPYPESVLWKLVVSFNPESVFWKAAEPCTEHVTQKLHQRFLYVLLVVCFSRFLLVPLLSFSADDFPDLGLVRESGTTSSWTYARRLSWSHFVAMFWVGSLHQEPQS